MNNIQTGTLNMHKGKIAPVIRDTTDTPGPASDGRSNNKGSRKDRGNRNDFDTDPTEQDNTELNY